MGFLTDYKQGKYAKPKDKSFWDILTGISKTATDLPADISQTSQELVGTALSYPLRGMEKVQEVCVVYPVTTE